jgi:hypothetical protein
MKFMASLLSTMDGLTNWEALEPNEVISALRRTVPPYVASYHAAMAKTSPAAR